MLLFLYWTVLNSTGCTGAIYSHQVTPPPLIVSPIKRVTSTMTVTLHWHFTPLYRHYITIISPLYLHYITKISPLYLHYIATISPLVINLIMLAGRGGCLSTLYWNVLHSTSLYSIVVGCTALHYMVKYYNELYCTVIFCTELFCIVLHCTILYNLFITSDRISID